MAAVIYNRPIRIGIVDDSELFRRVLHSSLDHLPNLQVVAEAENGATAIEMVEVFRPDVVLMDIAMPILDGIEATEILSSIFPETKIIVLTIYGDQTYADLALQAGACRFLTKDCGRENLLNAIKDCSAGPSKIVGQSPH